MVQPGFLVMHLDVHADLWGLQNLPEADQRSVRPHLLQQYDTTWHNLAQRSTSQMQASQPEEDIISHVIIQPHQA
jgi:hypothetical protein